MNSVLLRVNRYVTLHAAAPVSASSLVAAIGTNGSIRDPETGTERVGDDPISNGRYDFVPDPRRTTVRPLVGSLIVALWMGSSVYLPMRSAERVSELKERIRAIDGIKPGSYGIFWGPDELSDDTYVAPNADGSPIELYIRPRI